MKKISIIGIVTIIVGTLIFLGIRTFGMSNFKITVIDYNTYYNLKNNKESYILLITKSDEDKSSKIEETAYNTFKNKNIKVYEINIDKINSNHYNKILEDINKEISIPSLIYSDNGNYVYISDGYINSKDLENEIKDFNIK